MAPLAVIVLNWNDLETTSRCLERVAGWRSTPTPILVVDNGSSGGEARLLADRFPEVEVIASSTNRGFGGGANLGLEGLDGPFALLLNPDAEIDEAALPPLRRAIEQPRVAVAGPLLRQVGDGPGFVSAGGRDIGRHIRTHRRIEELPGGDPGSSIEADYVPGTVALVRVTAVAEAGGFDERYFYGGEMADLCRRLAARGMKSVVVPEASADHHRGGRSPARRARDAYYVLRNRFLYCRKHAPWRQVLWAAYALASIPHRLLTGRPRLARAHCLALVDGLCGRFGDAHWRFEG